MYLYIPICWNVCHDTAASVEQCKVSGSGHGSGSLARSQQFATSPLPRGLAGDEWKMSVSGLKAELKFLESIFDRNHERFRIIDWKPDELSCQFNVTGEKLLIIHCNITVR